ncbi:RHS repeat-associated core domain-containing protein [Polaribacter cellanae]|uniref:RHS repeat-associated core domain-containing protein n=1 Tax=Polaribacter cellanae TaxID=2818493 RepID=A0A975CL06_9FLAO|nr:RHS repeat-associated core domain-containing protein [Polaribacter cellanae]QTE21037.1 hypothetical protein J3359_09255 [Polaribacter cellanae]QTE21046.1 hypothetical protein J3359_09305 [Polaribacter cellanae]
MLGYVYQYKDQVNNVRLSYSDSNNDGIIQPATEILRESNFYPFGLEHRGYNNTIIGAKNNLKHYQGQEFTEDLGLNTHEWKYRVSDPAIGRFWQVDPLAEEYNYQSPYNFSENRVIDSYELEGLEKVSIHTASFAPFKTFGGPYKGDGANRKFTTNPSSSSRISGRVNVRATSTGISDRGSSATGSMSHNILTGNSSYSDASIEHSMSNNVSGVRDDGKVSAEVGFHLSGNNSLVPGSPDIDTKGSMTITSQQLGDKGSVISFSGKITGDKFPSNETFITDSNGVGVFLGVSGADGNPLISLPGNGNETMSTFNISVNFNTDGGITGVTYNKKNYTVAEWNKQFTKLDPKDGNVSTNNN